VLHQNVGFSDFDGVLTQKRYDSLRSNLSAVVTRRVTRKKVSVVLGKGRY
jgi:hypothetical protein